MFDTCSDLWNRCNIFNESHLELLRQNNEAIMKLRALGYEYVSNVIESSEIDENAKNKIMFCLRYMNSISALGMSPFNPQVIEEAINTNGRSLVDGFCNSITDFSKGLEVKTYNDKAFVLGENLAVTEGNIVYANEILELIYYTPSQEKNYSTPLFIVPPWINKYYILDLQQSNSLVKFLVDAGFPVFMISWVNPDSELSGSGFDDYLITGLCQALSAVQKIFPEVWKRKINILGYCIGGTLTTALVAYLNSRNTDILSSATFFATPVDFSDVGELGIFVDEGQISAIEDYVSNLGYFDGNHLRMIFSALKADEMIVKPFINNYLMGKDPVPFDILYWNSDSTNIPCKLHSYVLRNFYLNNLLIKPDGISINGTQIDIDAIDIPLCFVATEADHIVPWSGIYRNVTTKFKNAPSKKFILTGSGHVAGIVNPPSKNKHFYISDSVDYGSNFAPLEEFYSSTRIKGSWWDNWKDWLALYSGERSESFFIPKTYICGRAPGKNVMRRI